MKNNYYLVSIVVLQLLGLTACNPVKEVDQNPPPDDKEIQLHKRSIESSSNEEDMKILKHMILSKIANEMQELREEEQENELLEQRDELDEQESEEETQKNRSEEKSHIKKKKRLFLSLSGHRQDASNIKRQIRYHQCYFNPISCFRRK